MPMLAMLRCFQTFLGTVAVACLAASAHAGALGTLYFSQDSNPNGLYALNTVTGAATTLGASGVIGANVGLAESGNPNVLLGSTYFDIAAINADGSGAVELPKSAAAVGLAYDPTADALYGIIDNSFFTIDPVTGAQNVTLASPGLNLEGLAWAPGFIYGLGGFSLVGGPLHRYDIAAGVWSFVGNTGVDFRETGLAYDLLNAALYAIGSQDPNLYRIDPQTAAAEPVGDTGLSETGGGLAFVALATASPEPTSLALAALALTPLVWRRLAHSSAGVVSAL